MEIFTAVCLGIFVFLIIYILFEKKGREIDSVKRRLNEINNITKKNFVVDEEMSKSLSERIFRPMIKSAADSLSKLLPEAMKSDTKSAQNSKLKTALVQAGYSVSVAEYNAIRLLIILGLTLLFLLIAMALRIGGSGMLLTILLGVFCGYVATRYYLSMTVTKRKKEIESQLPDTLDLLSISVEAGLGFEQAIGYVASSMKGPLIDEFVVTNREMTMGRSRKDALTLLGERCNCDDVKSFTSAMVQAGQLGISMKNMLRSQADAARQARKAKIQESAMKVSLKILFPMLFFIFPVIFIVLIGPAVVNVMTTLR